MEVAWTAIGLLAAALFGMSFYLGSKVDGIAGRIDGMSGSINARIDALGARLDARIDTLTQMLATHIENHSR